MDKKETLGPEEKAAKEAINVEGWQDNAMVVIGTPEERERARKLVESEGRAVDLRSFIHLNKKIAAPAEFVEKIDPNISSIPEQNKGVAGFQSTGGLGYALFFFDKDLNLAEVNIDLGKIDEFKDLTIGQAGENMVKELMRLGFSFGGGTTNYFWDFNRIRESYQRHLVEQTKKEGFDF